MSAHTFFYLAGFIMGWIAGWVTHFFWIDHE